MTGATAVSEPKPVYPVGCDDKDWIATVWVEHTRWIKAADKDEATRKAKLGEGIGLEARFPVCVVKVEERKDE